MDLFEYLQGHPNVTLLQYVDYLIDGRALEEGQKAAEELLETPQPPRCCVSAKKAQLCSYKMT